MRVGFMGFCDRLNVSSERTKHIPLQRMLAGFISLSREIRSGEGYNYVSRQLLGDMLVEDFLHGQGDDDFVAANPERGFSRGRRTIDMVTGHG